MSAHAKKVEVVTSTLITDNDEFAAHLSKPGIRVFDVYAKFAGPCEPMTNIFKRLKLEYGETVAFIQNGAPIKVVRGANAPLVEKVIKELVESHKQGHTPPQLEIIAEYSSLNAAIQIVRDSNSKKEEVATKDEEDEFETKESRVTLNGSNSAGAPAEASTEATGITTESVAADGDGPAESTLGLIKPDAMHPSIIEEVLATIHRHRIQVVRTKKVWLTKEQVAELYREHESKEWFPQLLSYLSNAPVLALELSKAKGITLWREIVGPKDPKQAKAEFPKSLRALYGSDNLVNSFHASDSVTSSTRELEFIFGEANAPNLTELPFSPQFTDGQHKSSLSPQKTLAIIKPDAVEKIDEIIQRILNRGFKVQKREEVIIPTEKVQELCSFLAESDPAKFEEAVKFLTSGTSICLVLKGEDVIAAWKEMIGPADPIEAKTTAPMSIRAVYGSDSIRNAVHGSDNIDLAVREIHHIFPHYLYSSASMSSLFDTRPGTTRNSVTLGTRSLRGSLVGISRPSQGAKAPVEKTLALIKPDAYPGKKDEIVSRIEADGFKILAQKEVVLSLEKAQEFYKEHDGKPFYETLTKWMSSAPIYALVLEKEDGIKAWRKLAGPTNSNKAREESPESIRALFGTDGSENAVHGSDSPASAAREIGVIFGDNLSSSPSKPEVAVQKTLALIKPDAYPAKKDDILIAIGYEGFTILKEAEVHFTKEKAEEFYKEHKGKGFYEDLTNWMSSAPIYAIVLEKEDGIKAWRTLAGPTNSEKARESAPESIRARFGTDGSQNAVHGSDSPASAEREIKVVFGEHWDNENWQQTLALIKPDAYPAKKEEIVSKILAAGFTISRQSEVRFSKAQAETFYKEHIGKGFYEDLTTWMSSAPIYALVLEKEDAIKAWRALAGPTNSNKARDEAPESIRALFGTDGSQNAVHGSDSPASAEREIKVVFFPPPEEPSVGIQKTLALIKPDAYPTHKAEILKRINEAGFKIVEESEVHFEKEKAQEFYKEHEGKGFYDELTSWMSSAPIYAIVLEKENAIKAWRELAGPTNSEKARESSPNSIRALFGTNGSQNAVHGSDSPASAEREINVVFGSSDGDKTPKPRPKPPAAKNGSGSRPESPNKNRRTNPSTPGGGASAAQTPKRGASSSSLKKEAERQPSPVPNVKSSKPNSKPNSKPASKAGSKAASRAMSRAGSQANVVNSGSKANSRHPSRPTSALANPPIDAADVAAGAEAN
ncbi:Thioredoxin domain-containing protein 3 [Phlyctochytrium planicorne]|nr:Thioredoxin domain-containing protein 3 [Phlyctochytrium planicorne]